jgi:hypothetical protein
MFKRIIEANAGSLELICKQSSACNFVALKFAVKRAA